MEDEVARLSAELAALSEAGSFGNTAFAETYYYLTIPLMVLIHVGFLAYEMGASRQKNVLSSGVKNILAFAFLIPGFYFIGWFVYWAFPTGIDMSAGFYEISGWDYAMAVANPVGEVMGPFIGDNATGVFWGGIHIVCSNHGFNHVWIGNRAYSTILICSSGSGARGGGLGGWCSLGLAC